MNWSPAGKATRVIIMLFVLFSAATAVSHAGGDLAMFIGALIPVTAVVLIAAYLLKFTGRP